MKRLLIIWVVAIFGIMTVPAVSYVAADPPSTDDLQGPQDSPPTMKAITNTLPLANSYGTEFLKWCIEDGYGAEDCKRARTVFQAKLHWWLALKDDYGRGNNAAQTTEANPASHYADWYPGGSMGPTPSQPVPAPGTVHPGQVPSPMPQQPSRSPTVRCGCHFNMWWTT